MLLIGYSLLIHRYAQAWEKLAPVECPRAKEFPTVTIVVPFRNEEENLPHLLLALSELDYPKSLLEVVLIDDHSSDGSVALVQAAIETNASLQLLKLQDHVPEDSSTIAFKKKAIETGIAHSKGSWILTTDADCIFKSSWVSCMMSFASASGASCIAGPVKIEPGTTVLGRFQSLDFLTLQGITAAAVSTQMHMMCNGANFAYARQAFEEVDGFRDIDGIPSGDDMLLMEKIHKKYPDRVAYLKSADAVVTTKAAVSWKAFFQQRIRWASKTGHYDNQNLLAILGMVWGFNFAYLAMAIIVIAHPKWAWLLLLFVVAKWLIEYGFVSSVSRFFGMRRLMMFFLVLQPIHIVYTVIAGFFGKFGSYNWKGRVIKTAKL